MGNPKGVKRDFAALERRRLKAVKLFEQGRSQAEVARRLGVSHQSAGRWHAAWERGSRPALKHPGRAGRKSRLQPLDRLQLAADLQSGPEKTLGHATALWTLPRLVALIAQRFGHRYSTAQASRLWRQMGWSCQKPARRAVERVEQAIKKARRHRRTLVFVHESGSSQRPYVMRPWAPRGPPILRHPGGGRNFRRRPGSRAGASIAGSIPVRSRPHNGSTC